MQHLTTNFDKLDSNKDGKVNREEMRAARKAHKAEKQ
jgi:Ca2+-binding EF-hand superfamily protein